MDIQEIQRLHAHYVKPPVTIEMAASGPAARVRQQLCLPRNHLTASGWCQCGAGSSPCIGSFSASWSSQLVHSASGAGSLPPTSASHRSRRSLQPQQGSALPLRAPAMNGPPHSWLWPNPLRPCPRNPLRRLPLNLRLRNPPQPAHRLQASQRMRRPDHAQGTAPPAERGQPSANQAAADYADTAGPRHAGARCARDAGIQPRQ